MGTRTEQHVFRDERDADAFEKKVRAGLAGIVGYSEVYIERGKHAVEFTDGTTGWAINTLEYYG